MQFISANTCDYLLTYPTIVTFVNKNESVFIEMMFSHVAHLLTWGQFNKHFESFFEKIIVTGFSFSRAVIISTKLSRRTYPEQNIKRYSTFPQYRQTDAHTNHPCSISRFLCLETSTFSLTTYTQVRSCAAIVHDCLELQKLDHWLVICVYLFIIFTQIIQLVDQQHLQSNDERFNGI